MNNLSIEKLLSNQKNLERILDNLHDGIIAHDLNRRIFYFNREAEKITGYSRKEVIGKDCHQAFGDPFCGAHCAFQDTGPTLKDRAEYSMNIITKDSDVRRVEMSTVMMKNDKNQDIGILACFKDVSDLLNLQIKTGKLSGFSDIIGRDKKMQTVFQQIRDVAGYDFPVHIFGETGTGKELVAHAIHNESRRGRKSGPFVPINCGALPEGLIESELFGHVKGAFSGAIRDKKGRFELADGGTVFLDEVAELPKMLQVKLLRFLQDGIIEKVGGEKATSINVRIISATNKDLKNEVRQNQFREDLYYRLNVIPIHIPPLRERKTDIPLLADHFLNQINNKDQKTKKLSAQAHSVMMDYNWPGNVRELQNAVLFSIVKCYGRVINPHDLPMELQNLKHSIRTRGPVKKLNIDAVTKALIKTGGNKAKAARILRVGRATLYRFLGDHPGEFEGG
ncbi:MAG: sigma 54-interacting transcriptional regulator [Deltaproteobacteria bacterium]|nr:sigma 54-interacting transcriptional regulator [Deltaproteobacteria bacterium]